MGEWIETVLTPIDPIPALALPLKGREIMASLS